MTYSDYAEQLEISFNEAMSEFAHKGMTDYFFNQLSDFVETALREGGHVDAHIKIKHWLKCLMDVIYWLDTTRIDRWDEFVAMYGRASLEVTKRNHRKPPKPKWYYAAQPGQCKFCGQMITDAHGRVNRRASWHPDCLKQYKVVYWPDETKKAVWKRDRGACAACGEITNEWEMDHRRPLIESQGEIAFWSLGNCQTLCRPCHVEKTGAEAGQRSRQRKANKQKLHD